MQKYIVGIILGLCISISCYSQLNNVKEIDNDTITLNEYKKRTGDKDKLVLAYFSADWCLICARMKPVFQNIEKTYGKKLELLRIDTNRDKKITEEFEIDALPVMILYKKGRKQWIYVGIIEEKILKTKIELYL